jgi:hypothetical protein
MRAGDVLDPCWLPRVSAIARLHPRGHGGMAGSSTGQRAVAIFSARGDLLLAKYAQPVGCRRSPGVGVTAWLLGSVRVGSCCAQLGGQRLRTDTGAEQVDPHAVVDELYFEVTATCASVST